MLLFLIAGPAVQGQRRQCGITNVWRAGGRHADTVRRVRRVLAADRAAELRRKRGSGSTEAVTEEWCSWPADASAGRAWPRDRWRSCSG